MNKQIQLAAASFQLEFGTGSLGDGVWSFTSSSTIAATVDLPPGGILTGMTLNADRAGAGTITLTLCRKQNATKTVLATLSMASGSGWASEYLSLIVPPDMGYKPTVNSELYVRISCSSGHLIGGVFLEYETGSLSVAWFDSVGDALVAASTSGDTLFFPPGTYEISQPIDAGGPGIPGDLRIYGNQATIRFPSTLHAAFVFADGASNIVIDGLKFEGDSSNDYLVNKYAGLFFPRGNTDISLLNCEFSSCQPVVFRGDPESVHGRMLVSNCRFFNCTGALTVPGNTEVADSWFVNDSVLLSRSHAIYIFSEPENITVSRCHFKEH